MGDFGTGISSRDKWVCPNDRQLALRAKLRTGWSVKSSRLHSFTKPQQLDDTEQEAIMTVIKRAENIERLEQERVGRLVEKLENMKKNAIGNGASQCILCGDDFGLLGASNLACNDCRKAVCSKCGVDTFSAHMDPLWLCKICAETREMWKKSGAWFFKGLPKYVLPEKSKSNRTQVTDSRGRTIIGSPTSNAGRRGSCSAELTARTSTTHTVSNAGPPAKPARNFNTWSKGGVGAAGYGQQQVIQQRRHHDGRVIGQTEPVEPADVDVDQGGLVIDGEHRELSNCLNSNSDEELPEDDQSMAADHRSTPRIGARGRRKKFDSVGGAGAARPTDALTEAAAHRQTIPDNHLPSGRATCRDGAAEDDVDQVVSTYRRRSSSALPVDGSSTADDTSSTTVFDELEGSPEEGSVGSYGTLEFSLLFDSINGALHCTVQRAKGLRAMDCNGLSDPYVKMHLLPGASKSNTLRTKTVHKTLNPEFNETLTCFGITQSDISRKTIRLSVLDEDAFGHDFVGEARVPLKHIKPHQTKNFHVYLDRQHPLEKDDDLHEHIRGKILLSLRYSNQRQGLVVGIVRCSSLTSMDSNGFSDPFVKIQLKPDPLKKRFKTAIKWKNLNPEFNEEFVFDVKVCDLTKRQLEISVWDKDYGRTNDYLGGLQISLASKGGRLRHWLDVLKYPDQQHARWHHLGEEVLSD